MKLGKKTQHIVILASSSSLFLLGLFLCHTLPNYTHSPISSHILSRLLVGFPRIETFVGKHAFRDLEQQACVSLGVYVSREENQLPHVF